jgi:hypothetical protein
MGQTCASLLPFSSRRICPIIGPVDDKFSITLIVAPPGNALVVPFHKFQRVADFGNVFSTNPKTVRGRTTKIGSFMSRGSILYFFL